MRWACSNRSASAPKTGAAAWLAALPEVRDRLTHGGCVLDVGCGTGWSSIAPARAFPQTTVVDIDLDEASITEARDNAERADVADRVTFEVRNAAAYHPAGAARYDLACLFEALHDMGDPVAALRRIRAALAPGAPVLIADERIAEGLTAPADEVERFMYGWSVLHCLPATIDESDAVANGTVLREGTVRDWARQAGFRHVQTLPIDNDFWASTASDRRQQPRGSACPGTPDAPHPELRVTQRSATRIYHCQRHDHAPRPGRRPTR
jgi:SAM-dependent methyltransferase